MYDAYSTVINYFAQLELFEICVLASIPFLFFLTKILKKTQVRTVPKYYYYSLVAITVIMASGLALQNALYGYEQGTNLFRAAVTGTLFFVGDALLIALCYRFFPYWIAVIFGSLSIIGFAFMSMFAAFAFLVGQQHLKDNYQTTSKQAQIMRLDNHLATLDPRSTINRRDTLREISRLDKQIDRLSSDNGGYVSSGSAAYQMIAKATPYSFNEVSMYLRMFWSLAFVIGSMAGGGILAHLRIEDSVKKQSKPTDDVKQGKQPSGDTATSPKHYDRALKLIKNKAAGATVGIKSLRSKISPNRDTQNDIIQQLIDNGEMAVDTSKPVHKYTRLKPAAAKITNILGWMKRG